MSTTVTVMHVRDKRPEDVESALRSIFKDEDRTEVLRVQGSYSAILRRVADEDLFAPYRYIICSPHFPSLWTPVLEIGNRTVGLESELSRRLSGAPVVTLFVYGDAVSGYTVAREGVVVDRYVSDPEAITEEGEEATRYEDVSGHPERLRDLLPTGTDPDDFRRIVLMPGWWENYEKGAALPQQAADKESDEEDIVDEVDRMRCIGLAFEFWAPDEYPLATEPEDIPNSATGPTIGIAFA